MTQFYLDPLPDAETFYVSDMSEVKDDDLGWYWKSLLSRSAHGPFLTEADAIADARELACQDVGPGNV